MIQQMSYTARCYHALPAYHGKNVASMCQQVHHMLALHGFLTVVPPQPDCVLAGRQRAQALQGSNGAVRNTYAGYIQELQQSGTDHGNRLALHAGRRNTVSLSYSQLQEGCVLCVYPSDCTTCAHAALCISKQAAMSPVCVMPRCLWDSTGDYESKSTAEGKSHCLSLPSTHHSTAVLVCQSKTKWDTEA